MKIPFRVFYLFSILFLVVFNLNAQSQNFVYNGSFEEITECCDKYGMIEDAKGWFRITGSADVFKDCCNRREISSVPKNFGGWQTPQDGRAYAGLFILSDDKRYKDKGFYSKEYLHTQLLQKLVKDSKYKVTFYLSFGETSRFYAEHISVNFSKQKKILRDDPMEDLLIGENAVKYKLNLKESTDTLNWNKIEIEYKAKGGEEFLVIGSFASDITKQEYRAIKRKNSFQSFFKAPDCNGCRYAYYFIDNVSVVPINSGK